MNNQYQFYPNWISRPGATILRLLRDRELSATELARDISISEGELRNLLSGRIGIAPPVATKLANVLGGTRDFWLTRDEQYRHDIARREVKGIAQLGVEWAKLLPVKDMQRFGWIDVKADQFSLVRECLRFFDVGQLDIWHHLYGTTLEQAAFRKSERFTSSIGSVAAWFRQAELESDAISCGQWDPERFSDALPRLRTLTWRKNPAVFVPKLRDACANCGVAVVLVPLPKGCTTSGATWFSNSSKATLALSARYLSDDHFWFTFFHEAGHLLLHKLDGPIIEESEITSNKMEAEANRFAFETLIPREFREELFELRPSVQRIFAYSKKIGIAPGVVVGQMQHFGELAQSKLNGMKRRFVWKISNGSANLEMA